MRFGRGMLAAILAAIQLVLTGPATVFAGPQAPTAQDDPALMSVVQKVVASTHGAFEAFGYSVAIDGAPR